MLRDVGAFSVITNLRMELFEALADNFGDNFQLRGTVTTQLAAGILWTTGHGDMAGDMDPCPQ